VQDWYLSLFKGFAQGLLLGILSFGPSFFTLIHTGIQGGRSAGLRMALGIFLSESLVAMACFFGLSSYFVIPLFQVVFTGVACSALFFLGLRAILNKNEGIPEVPKSKVATFSKGFLMNTLNPFVFILWVGILATASVGYKGDTLQERLPLLIHLMGILLALFSLDLGKVLLSDFIGKKISAPVYQLITRYFGGVLVVIASYFAYKFICLLMEFQ